MNFHEELDELRLQVDVMALRVEQAIEAAQRVLTDGDADAARRLLESDDDIDRLHVSLTERCYDMLVRWQPMASDLRLVVSVVKALGELERIGNLCLRIAKLVEDQVLLARHPAVFAVVCDLAENVRLRFHTVQCAWSSGDLVDLGLLDAIEPLDHYVEPLIERILDLEGDDTARVAITAFVAGRSLDRIGDHATVLAARLRYLVTGDASYLAEEVRT